MSRIWQPVGNDAGDTPETLMHLIPWLQARLMEVPVERWEEVMCRVSIGCLGYWREETEAEAEAAEAKAAHDAYEVAQIPYYEKKLAAAKRLVTPANLGLPEPEAPDAGA